MAKSKKRESINILFDKLYVKSNGAKVIEFSNTELKSITQDTKFMNQFDATKYDSSIKLPERLQKYGYFIVHLGEGNHAFVRGEGYHRFEQLSDKRVVSVGKSLIDEAGKSEAGAASFLYNEKILQDFLGTEEVKVHTARRTKFSYAFNVNGNELYAKNQQIEIDGIFETNDNSIIIGIEAKNVEYLDFEIRQLFDIMKYFEMLKEKKAIPHTVKLRILFLTRLHNKQKDIIRVYEYKFKDKNDLNSIEFVKGREYIARHALDSALN